MPMINSLNWKTGTARLDPGATGNFQNITYFFVPFGSFAPTPGNAGGVMSEGWNTREQATFVKALGLFQTFLKVDFDPFPTADYWNSDFVVVARNFGNPNNLGAFGPPGDGFNWDGRGDFNNGGNGWDEHTPNGGLNQGGQAFETIIHELGHGLGLKHPHDDGGGGEPIYDGLPPNTAPNYPFGYFGTFQMNQGIYTMMSYNAGWQTGPAGTKPTNTFGNVGTPMAFDIAVLQMKYGANLTYMKGNNLYILPDANKLGTFWKCIWDMGGEDTIRYNGTKTAVIDLNMASLKHEKDGGGALSNARGIAGGFTIANKVWIENAVGGNGNDTINGNNRNNDLDGRNGHDTISGQGGADILLGGSGNDRMFGGTGIDRLEGGLGSDTLWGGAGRDNFEWNAVNHIGTGGTRDKIMDFQPGLDNIDLVTIDANGSKPGNGIFKFLTLKGDAFNGINGELRWYQVNKPGATLDRTFVEGDINGDGRADFQIEIVGLKNLTKGDFLL